MSVFPFETAEEEVIALLAKLTDSQLTAFRQRVMDGKIDGSTYWSFGNTCGCVYGTFLLVKGETEYLDELGIEVQVRDFIWGDDSGDSYTPLERKIFDKIWPGDTPETNEVSRWLLSHVDAALAGRKLDNIVAAES